MNVETLTLLKRTSEYFRQRRQPAYLVGGSLRDLLLGEPCRDWDIVTGGGAHALARRLADTLGGHYVRLHDKASRVIVKHETLTLIIDIAPQQGTSIEDDLRLRDFTINALAAPLDAVTRFVEKVMVGDGTGAGDHKGRPYIAFEDGMIDPVGGLEDVRARRLRVVNEAV